MCNSVSVLYCYYQVLSNQTCQDMLIPKHSLFYKKINTNEQNQREESKQPTQRTHDTTYE